MLALLPSLFSSMLPILAGLAAVGALVWLARMAKKSQLAEFREDELKQIKKINEDEDRINAETIKRKTTNAGSDNNSNRVFWK